jgi:hypothetical protein
LKNGEEKPTMGGVVPKYHYKFKSLSSFKKESSGELLRALFMAQISKEDDRDFWTFSDVPKNNLIFLSGVFIIFKMNSKTF